MEVQMLVQVTTLPPRPTQFGASCPHKPLPNKKLEKFATLVWKDKSAEWSLEVWSGEEHYVALKQNGNPADEQVNVLWRNLATHELERLSVSKRADETLVNIAVANAMKRIRNIIASVQIG